MAVRQIMTAPHPILSQSARAVEEGEFGEDLHRLTSDMAETMYATYGVGLAAPQIADSRCIIVLDPTADGRNLFRMVNPEITARSTETVWSRERCLSVPALDAKVQRHVEITVRWQDPLTGEAQESVFADFPATVVQHELDHLAGRTLFDHASHMKRARYMKALKRR